MKSSVLPIIGICCISSGCTNRHSVQIQEHPNIIYVFPDQYRNMAMGFWKKNKYSRHLSTQGDPVHTPNIDRFAEESLVLSSAMSNCPLSSPYRGSLFTGMYPHESGVPLNCNANRPVSSLRVDLECMSDVFRSNGYDCAYFGKLHTDFPTPNDPDNPGNYVDKRKPAWDAYTPKERRHGFNYWYSYGTYDVHKNPHYWDNDGKKHEPKEWSPLHEAKEVISYLKNDRGQRDEKKPFLVMVGMNPPHTPYKSLSDCMEEDFNLYKDIPIDSLLVRPNADKNRPKSESVRYYFASVTGVDRAFGMILDCLEETGLDKNTIVVFTSDHGETMCSQFTDDPKNSPYAESMNVPFIIRYPGKIRPRVDDLLLSTPDIMPTMLGMCNLGEAVPEGIHGHDYSSLFEENTPAVVRPECALYIQNIDGVKNQEGKVVGYFPSSRGVKTHRYTFALYIDKDKRLAKTLLFDDVNDPYQLNNLPLDENKKIVDELTALLAEQLKIINDPWYKEQILGDLIKYD